MHAKALRDSCLVVIPALNEEATIENVVWNLRQRGFERATRPPERRGLFLRYLIIQRDGG